MTQLTITRIIFSSLNNKWYLEINDGTHQVETSEETAKDMIAFYGLSEYNLNRWSL